MNRMFFLVSGHGRGPLSRRDSQTTPPAHLGPLPVKMNASNFITKPELHESQMSTTAANS